jgi:hypothetical protein
MATMALTARGANAPATSSGDNTPALPGGAEDVLKLSRAKVGEDTIVAFVKNSNRAFGGLGANQIVYLHEQGVSDSVIATMISQTWATQ